ncbi:MAG: helix-turn-helix transcriptional regulator [Ruminococcus sp.]|nr:helix-turn-helix transcriptional regulator [Ruminococcus sp.]
MSLAFGKHLRELRKERTSYNQEQMAKMLNISRSTYTYYEIGKSEPGNQKLKALSRILGVDMNELLNYDEQI